MAFDVSPFSVNAFYGHQAVKNSLLRRPRQKRKQVKGTNSDEATILRPSAVAKWPKEFPPRLLGPTVCWRTFYRQSEAFEFARHFAEDVYIFAFESATDPTLNKGQRKYLATSLPVFWHYYSQLPDTRKSHYEIIPEGSPCKLYLDLEFQRDYNPSRDGIEMTETFVKFVCLWLQECYGIDVDRSNVLDLDASTSSKFSRHLIFQLPDAVFENNVSAGKFVHFITANLIHHIENISSSPDESMSSPDASFSSEKISPATDFSRLSEDSIVTSLSLSCKAESATADSSNVLEDIMNTTDGEMCVQLETFSKEDDVHNSKTAPPFTQKLQHQNVPGQEHTSSMTRSGDQNSRISHISNSHHSSSQRRTEEETFPVEKDAKSLCSKVCQKLLNLFCEENLKNLLVRKKDGAQTLFCDLGVYTRNRNFRLYLSSKLNKHNPLVIAKENTFKPASKHETFECDIFYASLVSHTGSTKGTKSVLSFDGQGLGKSIRRTMRETQPKVDKSNVVSKADSLEGWNCISPYPEVDDFIMSLIASKSHSGSIRHWTYFIQSETLLFDIVGYRWCGNIGRQHKSNNIMYVTDLRQGVYYQKCYDPECQASQYRSPECPLPPSVLPGYYFLHDGDDDTLNAVESEDELLIAAVEDVELMQALDSTTVPNPSPSTQNG